MSDTRRIAREASEGYTIELERLDDRFYYAIQSPTIPGHESKHYASQ